MRKTIDQGWKTAFGYLLDKIINTYKLNVRELCNEISVTPQAFSNWKNGKRLPQAELLTATNKFIKKNIVDKGECEQYFVPWIKQQMSQNGYIKQFYVIRNQEHYPAPFLCTVLELYWNLAQKKEMPFIPEKPMLSSNRIKAVVFDFDGTLTKGNSIRTTWECLWMRCGYSVMECQKYHRLYDEGKITHKEWCAITEKHFKQKGLNRTHVSEIANRIELIPGINEVFNELRKRDIKIYIVSGSIKTIIQEVLKELAWYVEDIRANTFRFDLDGNLEHIIGTKYDFEGKANFIMSIAYTLDIATDDILFVGNSLNDRFAYQSGARTLCINPSLTDPTNKTIWNDYLQTCEDLKEILPFIIGFTV